MFGWLKKKKSRSGIFICEACNKPFLLTPIEVSFYIGRCGVAPKRCRTCQRSVPVEDSFFSAPAVLADENSKAVNE